MDAEVGIPRWHASGQKIGLRSHKSRLGETEGGPGSVDEIDIRDWCEVAG